MYKLPLLKSWILLLALLLLLLPNLCFLLGWYSFYVAIPLCCLLSLSVIIIWYKARTHFLPTSSSLSCSRSDIIKLIICLIGALIIVETISFHGHFYQSVDFFVRNPIYNSLIEKPWPLYGAKGEYFVYYLAFWLPPALVAKYIGHCVSPATLLFVWSYLYLSTGIILIFSKIKGRILSFCVILLMLGTIAPELAHAIVKLSNSCYQPLSQWLCTYGVDGDDFMRYVPFWALCRLNFNVALPGFLCLSILFSGMLPKRYWCVPAAFIVQPALLCAAALFPWLMICLLKRRDTRKDFLLNPYTWIFSVFVLLIVLYFSCMSNGNSPNGVHIVWPTENNIGDGRTPINRTVRALLLSVPLIISLYSVIGHRLRRTSTFIGGCIVAAVIPFIWVGMRNNEFLFKGSIVVYFLFAWVLLIQWYHASKKHKMVIVIFLILSSSHLPRDLFTRHTLCDFGLTKEKIERHILDPYRGSIDNMSDYIRNQFFTENRYPFLLLTDPAHKSFPPH